MKHAARVFCLVALATCPAYADDAALPTEVRASINDYTKHCGKNSTSEVGFLNRVDVNADGIQDFIIDYGFYKCGSNCSPFCGTGGCLRTVFVSSGGRFTKVLDENLRSVTFKRLKERPAMILGVRGSACGEAGAEACEITYYWNGSKFAR